MGKWGFMEGIVQNWLSGEKGGFWGKNDKGFCMVFDKGFCKIGKCMGFREVRGCEK